MRKLRLGGIKWLGQILRASERQSPDHTEMAYLSRPCTSPCCLWPGRASRNLCQALACSPSHPLLPLTWLHPVSQWDWPQAACNSTDIRVSWLLIEFATGWHWKEVGEEEQKHLGVSLLQSTHGGQSASITSVVQLQEGPSWLQVLPGDLASYSLGPRGQTGFLMLVISVLPQHPFGFWAFYSLV